MILTVTPNTALDRVLFLPELQPGRRNQAAAVVESMGGKGCNVAQVLRELGEEATATGLAAGATGRRMEATLRAARVVPDFVWVGGDTRWNTVVIETTTGRHTTICAGGLEAGEDALTGLITWMERWLPSVDAVSLSGSLPDGWPPAWQSRLVQAALAGGKPLIVDAAGAALLAALDAGPLAAIKPNREELESIFGPLQTAGEVVAAARRLQERGAERVLASLGVDGAILVSGQGAWRATPLAVPVVNPAGAGDGMTACLALGAARGWDEVETLRWASAVAAAIVTTRGTAELDRAAALRWLEQVRILRHE